ncbi:hypothetical protein RCL_jg335.t2 [Rhizophagus clarus]|uniref:Uncharacterized protein n=1 Tax=Rhizophagus clarus TaxID=94130 RepID=A0A8H3QXP2_9GLOM|nr:hypothetical protein RCL_jg335.t2 [Rhizophagus clarus]
MIYQIRTNGFGFYWGESFLILKIVSPEHCYNSFWHLFILYYYTPIRSKLTLFYSQMSKCSKSITMIKAQKKNFRPEMERNFIINSINLQFTNQNLFKNNKFRIFLGNLNSLSSQMVCKSAYQTRIKISV